MSNGKYSPEHIAYVALSAADAPRSDRHLEAATNAVSKALAHPTPVADLVRQKAEEIVDQLWLETTEKRKAVNLIVQAFSEAIEADNHRYRGALLTIGSLMTTEETEQRTMPEDAPNLAAILDTAIRVARSALRPEASS